MAITFARATKYQSKLRLALIGPSGSGKTYSALAIAQAMGKRVALIDTEHGSASKYADLFQFDTVALTSFSPDTYIEAIRAAEAGGYDVLIIDSLSHAWAGKGGILEFVEQERARTGDAFGGGWRKATPRHNELVETILAADLHIIATMRSKVSHVVETDPQTHKTIIRKVGLQPIQRDGLEYEFDVVGDLDQDNTLYITKTRCPSLVGDTIEKPGAQLAAALMAWLSEGAPLPSWAAGHATGPTAAALTEETKPTERLPRPPHDATRGQKLTWIAKAIQELRWHPQQATNWLKKHFQCASPSLLTNGQVDEAIQMLHVELNPAPSSAAGDDEMTGTIAEVFGDTESDEEGHNGESSPTN